VEWLLTLKTVCLCTTIIIFEYRWCHNGQSAQLGQWGTTGPGRSSGPRILAQQYVAILWIRRTTTSANRVLQRNSVPRKRLGSTICYCFRNSKVHNNFKRCYLYIEKKTTRPRCPREKTDSTRNLAVRQTGSDFVCAVFKRRFPRLAYLLVARG